MDTLMNMKKRRKSHDLLFPGLQLKTPLQNPRQVATITGSLFEAMTECLFDGERITTDSTAKICPDVWRFDSNLVIESKCSSGRFQLKIDTQQIGEYKKESERTGVEVVYCLWYYSCQNLTKTYKNVQELIEAVLSSVRTSLVLDVNIIEAMHKHIPGSCWTSIFKNKATGERMERLVLGKRWLHNFLTSPMETIRNSLKLPAEDYEYLHRPNFGPMWVTFDGKEFVTNQFNMVSVTHRSPEE